MTSNKLCGHPCDLGIGHAGNNIKCCRCWDPENRFENAWCRQCKEHASTRENIPKPKGDAIDGPAHYRGYQVLELINDSEVGFEVGNVIKYCARSKQKGKELEDLGKAQFYLDWYIRRLEGEKVSRDED